jgi:hypothetical protein
VAEVSRWHYATSDDGVSVVLYGSSRYETAIGGAPVVLEQQTDYPWSGSVEITVEEAPPHHDDSVRRNQRQALRVGRLLV